MDIFSCEDREDKFITG